MTTRTHHKLILAISSSALFDLNDSDAVFMQQGSEAYARYQMAHEQVVLNPGSAFNLVKKLLALDPKRELIEVILLSRNSADTGLRVFNSIQHYALNITRAAFLSGQSPYQYINAFQAHLFLSAHPADVRQALHAGCAAATLLAPEGPLDQATDGVVRIAFDGDAVLFSDESERIYQQQGLAAFTAHEQHRADEPLSAGPFKGFLSSLHELQKHFPADACPIRTALITAREAPAHKRVIHTLRHWGIRIDEALFLGGLDKSAFLRAFKADVFFDDQPRHCASAAQHVATGHVPHGVINQPSKFT